MADQLAVRETIIPGFFEIDLVLHGDNRGWFKENYQKEAWCLGPISAGNLLADLKREMVRCS